MPPSPEDEPEPTTTTAAAASITSAADDESESTEEDPFPPALIVRTRHPDRGVSKIVGNLSPAQAQHGVAVTFGISVAGRDAERSALSRPPRGTNKAPTNVHSLPFPRLQPRPTRVATSTPFDGGTADDPPSTITTPSPPRPDEPDD
ncbi:MAG: hypothetical protein K0V04_08710 [Deltaproteobacteria bacterium]|nr:hypothetical protein [Deltaproteobacteria bacterium]